MRNFRSGIIFKDKTIIAQGDDDSHTTLLEGLNIEDSTANAMTLFVRAELLPPNGEWWTNPDTWCFNVGQDVLPDWFINDRGKYETMFREEVKAWWIKHVLVNKEVDNLSSGFYMAKDCHIAKLTGDVYIWKMCASQVDMMYNASQVDEMRGNSRIWEMFTDSRVGKMNDDSCVGVMNDDSCVGVMFDDSCVGVMNDCSRIEKMHGNSRIGKMFNCSRIEEMHEDSWINKMFNLSAVCRIYSNSIANKMRANSVTGLYSL